METEAQNKNYELAYHLNSDIEETEIRKNVQELEDVLAGNGAAVLISREPKRKHLSYPLKHKHYSYFGHIDFSGLPETIIKINTQMKLQHNLLRYLITEKPDEKGLRVLGIERPRPKVKTHEPSLTEADKVKKDEAKPEQIEKEIEDVLEKI